jgi:transcriptional regulator with XRE-family HTH domain
MGAEVYGDRLRQARILRQWKLSDIAELLDCSAPTMSKWERARTVGFSASRLSTISETLKFSPEFFSTAPSPPLFDNDLLFKAPKSTPKREIEWLRELIRLISELLDWLDERQPLPPVKLSLRSSSKDIRDAGRELRQRLSLPLREPIEYLTHSVERAGVIIVVRRRPYTVASAWENSIALQQYEFTEKLMSDSTSNERHEGCSSWVGEFRERPLIVMRGVKTWEKTRWVLAHELGHLSLHAGRTFVSEESEAEASFFASELLAPIEAIAQELSSVVTLAKLLEVKFKWGISLAALIRHLHANGVITDQRKKTLYAQLYTRRNPETGRSFGATEPGWDKREPERPRLISAWLERIVGSVTPEAIASISGIFPADILGSVLSEQRDAPVRSGTSQPSGRHRGDHKVVYLRDRLLQLQSGADIAHQLEI